MKKTIRHLMLTLFLMIAANAFSQSAQPVFISKIVPPIPVPLTESAGIQASRIDGSVDNKAAFSLSFHNTSDHAITFTWTLKDAEGRTVGDAQQMSLASGTTADYTTVKQYGGQIVFVLPDGDSTSGYTVSITIN